MGFLEDIGLCLDADELYDHFGIVGKPYYLDELERVQLNLKLNSLADTCLRLCTEENYILTSFSPRMKECIGNCGARAVESDYLVMRKIQTRPDNPEESLKKTLLFGKKMVQDPNATSPYDYHIRYPYLFKEGTRFPPEIISLAPRYQSSENHDPEDPEPRIPHF